MLEPEDKVLLTVTFDGAWESYVRIIWQKVTRLLDLVFCNTEGYVLGYENSYEEWGVWLKQAQSEAYFLYATPGLTVDDTRYLQHGGAGVSPRSGRSRRVARHADQNSDGRGHRTAVHFRQHGGPIGTDPTNAGFGVPLTKQDAGRPPFRQGVRSLVGLYRLADVYPPGHQDGEHPASRRAGACSRNSSTWSETASTRPASSAR